MQKPVSSAPADSWWRGAAIYQLYVRSFADGNGDGIGDLAGARARLPYLAALGIDAIWFNPWYPSPMADAGYDISDYRGIDPVFGSLADADALIAEAHALGIRIIIDVVPNHCSSAHPWFIAALAAGPGSAERDRFWFRPGRGPGGDLPPNNWQSIFGGPAWTRVTPPDGTPGEWYLHLFAPEQPDFNWGCPAVRLEFEDVLKFWFDRGVDGIRIDSAALLSKDAALPDVGSSPEAAGVAHPYTDRDDVHSIYRSWRSIADQGQGRVLIGEIWLPDAARLARYVRPGELHTVFNFPYLSCPWDAAALRQVIDETLALNAPAGAPATWVLSNHDVDRIVTRYGRADTAFDLARRRYFHGFAVDLPLGTRRARAAALLTMALPGSVYIYQGEELGLGEVQDISDELRQDPIFHRTGGEDPGRDGSRVPLPWSGTEPPFGFSPAGASSEPWLRQPKDWRELTVAASSANSGSMLALYRDALRIRSAELAAGDTVLAWQPMADGVLAFDRGSRVRCIANLSSASVALPPHTLVLLASGPVTDGGLLPPDTTVWLRVSAGSRSRLIRRTGGLRHAELVAFGIGERDPGVGTLLAAVQDPCPAPGQARHRALHVVGPDSHVQVQPVLDRLGLRDQLEQHSRRAPGAVGVADGRPVLPDERPVVHPRVAFDRVPGADHPPDEGLVLRLDLPAQRLGPPVRQRVRVRAVHRHLERVRHRSSLSLTVSARRRAVGAEERAQFLRVELGLLERGEVAAARKLGQAHDVRRALEPRFWRCADVGGKEREA